MQVLPCGTDALWVIREAGVSQTSPWLVSAKGTQAIRLPDQTRFVAFHPERPLLLAVTAKGLERLDVAADSRQTDARKLKVTQVHPWLVAQPLAMPDWHGFTYFADGTWWLVPWSEDGAVHRIAVAVKPPHFPERDFDLAWWQPRVMPLSAKAVWMDADRLVQLNLRTKDAMAEVSLPSTGPMERMVALPHDRSNDVDWLVYGGKRGDLDSFGWQVRSESKSSAAAGEGIFVGYGYTPGPQARLWVWTVSRSFSSQLWQRLRGTVKYSVTVLQRSATGWQTLAERNISLDEADDGLASELRWGPDINGDGLGDLIAIDPGAGLRAYPASRDHGMAEQSMSLGDPAQGVFALAQRLVRAVEGDDYWTIEVLP